MTSVHLGSRPRSTAFQRSTSGTARTVHSGPWRRRQHKASLGKSELGDVLREMLLIRRFEEKVEERFRAGELPGFLHVAIGQEAVRRRRLPRARGRRRDRVDPSRARAHAREGDAPERADGRAVRQARGLLARLRRLDAPLRRRARQPRRERRRRRRAAARSPAPRSPSSCAASRASRSRSSATARRTSARSTRR